MIDVFWEKWSRTNRNLSCFFLLLNSHRQHLYIDRSEEIFRHTWAELFVRAMSILDDEWREREEITANRGRRMFLFWLIGTERVEKVLRESTGYWEASVRNLFSVPSAQRRSIDFQRFTRADRCRTVRFLHVKRSWNSVLSLSPRNVKWMIKTKSASFNNKWKKWIAVMSLSSHASQ